MEPITVNYTTTPMLCNKSTEM